MKTLRTLFVIAVATLGFATSSFAQTQNSATISGVAASSRIITALSIAKQGGSTELKFGDVISGETSGTVLMTPWASRTSDGGVTLGNSATASSAKFTVNGQASSTYTIQLPGSDVTITGPDSQTMTITDFTADPGETGTTTGTTGTLSLTGTQNFQVGGTLHVGANQQAGSYSGTFNVTVNYN